MSVEADFGISEWVFQSSGTQVSWEIAWDGVLEDSRFAAISFQSDFVSSRLERVSESFVTDGRSNPRIDEVIRCTEPFGGSAFRFAVVVIPNH
jgi:hypothetical protein